MTVTPHLKPGDTFTTTTTGGRVLVWLVDADGLVRLQPGSALT